MSPSKKEKDFAEAMALKLGINRQARAEQHRLIVEYGDFRYDLAKDCISRHQKSGRAGPGLTIASVLKHMDTWGF